MLGLGGKREWPIFLKTAVRQRLKNRRNLATIGHLMMQLSVTW
jgi:hypothetical protein